MQEKLKKKLALSKETLQNLAEGELDRDLEKVAAGNANDSDAGCTSASPPCDG
jgi:hypothetical protein